MCSLLYKMYKNGIKLCIICFHGACKWKLHLPICRNENSLKAIVMRCSHFPFIHCYHSLSILVHHRKYKICFNIT